MQLDQNKSVGHPALFEGKDRLKDDHVRVLVDALSNTCNAAARKLGLTCLVLSLAHIGFLHNVVSPGPFGLGVSRHSLRPVQRE